MKIGVFSDTFLPVVDGVGRYVYDYTSNLTNKGHECTVITTRTNGYKGKEPPFDVIKCSGIPVPGVSQYRFGLPLFDPDYRTATKRAKFDIIHANSPFAMGHEALKMGRRDNVPVVGTFHSKYYDDFVKVLRVKQIALIGVHLVVDFFNRCDDVWAHNNYSASTLQEYGYKREIQIVPVGSPRFNFDPEDELRAREKFAIKDNPVLLYVGQINWKKNLLRTLEAVAMLKENGKKFTLVLTGMGPDFEAVSAKAKQLGIYDWTVFTGHISDPSLLKGVYKTADLFLFPSLYDTYGEVIREAASASLASVVVRGSGPAECIIDGVNGFYCEDNSENMAKVLIESLSDMDRIKGIGEKAKETIFMPWERVMEMATSRYEKVIAMKNENS